MAFDALDIAVALAAALREPLARLRQHDKDLADQARRAANGVALQIAEGRKRQGRDRLHLWRIAAGSAEELGTALRLAVAWGYLDPESLRVPRELLDRVLAMLWRLSH